MTDKDVIRMALNTLLLLPSSGWIPGSTERTLETIQTLRAALAQPEPEPVAWMLTELDGTPLIDCDDLVVKPRPVLVSDKTDCIPLYTAPPAKEWAGLTDDEYELMAEKRVTNYFFNTLDYAHDIEAKLKEKNT
jgi:hypothetical protein